MQSSVTVELSVINELLMTLLKGKAVDSQQCYSSGEGTSFNASEVDTLVDDVFIDIPASIIDDQLIDKEKGTYISEDLRGGIILIDIPLGGKGAKRRKRVRPDNPLCKIPVKFDKQFFAYLSDPRRARSCGRQLEAQGCFHG
ncbi:uncharacterized protein E6C27_scaffold1276G00570 [Cucumis melo var. makuwa]|uniref:Uncharacterized protein n=1 Tax=Cucumis melo var. makuwa TaxID=1194695 RepID=A0A5A7ST87_CUCMM|nr:uncharacterized protein E6C27_scaffold1276G00570 [Cucumis melo var. makuwa]